MREIVGSLLLCASLPAVALDLIGFTIGKELTAADKAEITRDGKGLCTPAVSCTGTRKLGDYDVQFNVFAPAGIVRMVMLTANNAYADAMKKSAVEKFGRPTQESPFEYQNKVGAKFKAKGAMWRMADGSVDFLDHCGAEDSTGQAGSACLIVKAKGPAPDTSKKMPL